MTASVQTWPSHFGEYTSLLCVADNVVYLVRTGTPERLEEVLGNIEGGLPAGQAIQRVVDQDAVVSFDRKQLVSIDLSESQSSMRFLCRHSSGDRTEHTHSCASAEEAQQFAGELLAACGLRAREQKRHQTTKELMPIRSSIAVVVVTLILCWVAQANPSGPARLGRAGRIQKLVSGLGPGGVLLVGAGALVLIGLIFAFRVMNPPVKTSLVVVRKKKPRPSKADAGEA